MTSANEGLGLLATGASGRWEAAVDESLDGEARYLELEGPQTYLAFSLLRPDVIGEAVRFLRLSPSRAGAQQEGASFVEASLVLGRFGAMQVTLLRDDEDFPRCFLVIGPENGAALRVSLDADDMRSLAEALEQLAC